MLLDLPALETSSPAVRDFLTVLTVGILVHPKMKTVVVF